MRLILLPIISWLEHHLLHDIRPDIYNCFLLSASIFLIRKNCCYNLVYLLRERVTSTSSNSCDRPLFHLLSEFLILHGESVFVLKTTISHGQIHPWVHFTLVFGRALFRIAVERQRQSGLSSQGNETVTSRYSLFPETSQSRHNLLA